MPIPIENGTLGAVTLGDPHQLFGMWILYKSLMLLPSLKYLKINICFLTLFILKYLDCFASDIERRHEKMQEACQ